MTAETFALPKCKKVCSRRQPDREDLFQILLNRAEFLSAQQIIFLFIDEVTVNPFRQRACHFLLKNRLAQQFFFLLIGNKRRLHQHLRGIRFAYRHVPPLQGEPQYQASINDCPR